MRNTHIACVVAILLMASVSTSFAGGPLILFDAATQTAYAYPPGVVDVYTDLGNNGLLTGAESDGHTVNGYAEWTAVASSYFQGAVAGDFSAVGLPDIDGFNAGLVVNTFNGGGIHVMYDDDGTITSNFFGAPPGVLGIASPDFATTGTNELLESWAMINGTAADPLDIGGATYSGVFTHEFGHSINLAHVQVNGAAGFFLDGLGPDACATPYGGGLTLTDFETMYPFLDITPGSTGGFQATVEMLDDVASISNIYPTGGWPNNTGTISGKVFAPDGFTEITGINVIARNVADPYQDVVTALSGDFTQGDLGPDGRFTLNGLTPGADYVVYIDEIVAGGFSTPPGSIPGDGNEEYWNANESADPGVDDPCEWTFIQASAGGNANADIITNGNPNDLDLGDDDFVEVLLPFSFPFCGQSYNTVFVGSNGFLTFGQGDTDFSESVEELLNGPPRICGIWDDLNPTQGGSITAQPVGADFVIQYDNVPEFFATGSNTFRFTLRADGTYDVDYGVLTMTDGLAGRTEGGGADDPGETDLSAAPQPIGTGLATVYEYFTGADNDLSEAFLAFDPCVIPDPPAIAIDPTSFTMVLCEGESNTEALTISNIGDLDLTYNILSDQLFVPAGHSFTGGVIESRDLNSIAAGVPVMGADRVNKMRQDAHASANLPKPEISPWAVPLPHAFALSLLNEDFNSGFPAGWTAIDNEGNGVIWQVPQQGTGNHTGGTGDAAGANSDFVGPADYDTELWTPPISGFGPNVVLSYVANYQNFAAWDFFDVDVSTDGGVNWTNVLSWNEDHGGFFSPPGEQVALNLDAFVAGAPEFIVRWRWYDPTTTNDFDWYVQIDDVLLVSDEPLTPCSYLSVNPTGGTIAGDGSENVDVTFDATGFSPGTYECELIIFSNAVNEPRLVVPLTMIVPELVTMDLIPTKCPNIVHPTPPGLAGNPSDPNARKLRAAIVGTDDIDVSFIDFSSLALEGVAAEQPKYQDRYRAVCNTCDCTYNGVDISDLCTCTCRGKDGHIDLSFYFNLEDVLAALGNVSLGTPFEVTMTGNLLDGTLIKGLDCLIVANNNGGGSGGNGHGAPGGGIILSSGPQIPKESALDQNFPNPFNPTTTIRYGLSEAVSVELRVYNSAGQLVRTLVSGSEPPGFHTVTWDGRSDSGSQVATGVYFYKLIAGDFVQTRRMVLLK